MNGILKYIVFAAMATALFTMAGCATDPKLIYSYDKEIESTNCCDPVMLKNLTNDCEPDCD